VEGTDGSTRDRVGRYRWLHALLLAATLVLLVVFARHVDWSSTKQALRQADPGVIAAAIVIDLASLVVRGMRWGLLLRAVGARGTIAAVRDTIVGAALNNVLVANGGDAARVAITTRRARVSSADVIAALVVERFNDIAMFAALFGALALGVALPGRFARWKLAAVVALAVTVVLCGLLVSRRTRHRAVHARENAPHLEAGKGGGRGVSRVLGAIARYTRQLASATATVASGRRLAIALALSLVVWGGQWATFHVAAHAAALSISWPVSLLALIVVNASFLVRLTPGNVGIFQLLYVLAATAAGLDRNRALAAGLLIQLVQYIPVTFIGLLLTPAFVRSTWRRERQADAPSNRAGTPLR
jgi:uncharacterized protein (TIRG00374 family)